MSPPLQTLLVNFQPDYWERTWFEALLSGVTLEYVTAENLDERRPTLVLVSDIGDRFSGETEAVLRRFQNLGRPAGLVHVGDECYHCKTAQYRFARFVVRNYFRPQCTPGMDGLVHHLPLGYKPRFAEFLKPRPVGERKYRWSFAGAAKGRRVKMLRTMDAVPGGHTFITRLWDDPNGLTTQQYAELMSDSVFVPCPRGNESVDCYRVYEALEAGAIPIVEDDGRWAPLLDRLPVPAAVRHKRFRRGNAIYRSRMGVSYWRALYGPDFALPIIHDWREAGPLIACADTERMQADCQGWWQKTKTKASRDFSALLTKLANTRNAD